MKINRKEFYIPNNLNIRNVLKSENKSDYYIRCQIDKYHWFFNTLYLRGLLNKKYDNGDFIPMNLKFMRDLLGKRYADEILNILEKHDIIESDGKYIVGEKSIGYRLKQQFQVNHVRIFNDSESKFFENLKNHKDLLFQQMDEITEYTHFQLSKIGINRQDAERWINEWYDSNLKSHKPSLLKKLSKQNRKRKITGLPPLPYRSMLDHMKDAYLYQVKAIDEKLWIPIRDSKGRRIHSFLSNMKKELRQFLFLKDNPSMQLIALDCSNSQPFTLVKIILDYFKGRELTADVQNYINLVENGRLYNFMCEKLNITQQEEISDFKTTLFSRVFYCSNQKSFYATEAEIFHGCFPTVYQIIMQEKKFQYNLLSIEMQKVETEAILDGVLTTLMHKYHYSVFFSSIHDSIICPADYEEEVRQLMINSYTKVVGIAPHIKESEKLNMVNFENMDHSHIELNSHDIHTIIIHGLTFEIRNGIAYLAA